MVSHGPAGKSPFGGMLAPRRRRKMCLPEFPLIPRHLRRPFSAATGSGRYFFAQGWNPPSGYHRAKTPCRSLRSRKREDRLSGKLSRSAPGDAETSGMGLAVAQPLSPELVLVCPELRAHALELLPARDPDALFAVAPRPAPRLVEVTPLPERRALPSAAVRERRASPPVAVAAYFAEALVLGALRGAAMIAAIAALAFLLAR
jgi:hypothetical protein